MTVRDRTLFLPAFGLFSKFGFNDGGSVGDWLLDADEYRPVSEHAVLIELVKTHLLPVLEAAGHTFTVTEILTSHNPIRIATWYGEEWDDYADAPESVKDMYVEVPERDVWAAIDKDKEEL